MTSCPHRLQLEAAALGEVHEGRVAEIERHAERCPRCRHELSWLRAESALFAQRAAREEVGRLWESLPARAETRRASRFSRLVLGLAASALLAVAVGPQLGGALRGEGRHDGGEPAPMSLELMSVEQSLASLPCYTPGHGIACGEVRLASR